MIIHLVSITHIRKQGFQKAELNPKWKGGRTNHISGYIFVRCEGHPRSYDKGHYVFEHVLVMEKHLGRYLRDKEIVHHINGIKDDNRIENLQLFQNNSKHVSIHMKGRQQCKGKHNTLGKHKDTSNRVCFRCGSKTTLMKAPFGHVKTPYAVWHHLPEDRTNWYCHKCYDKYLYHEKIKKQSNIMHPHL